MAKKKQTHYSGIGGQAVLEGVMMKNRDKYAVAVRKPNGEIEVEVEEYKGICGDKKFAKLPFIRGVFAFIDSLVLGMKVTTYSASFYEEEDEKPSKTEEKLEKMQKRFGGYWRYPKLIDFCYLVNPYYPPVKLKEEMKSNFETLLTEYPSGMEVNALLAAGAFGVKPEHIIVGNGAAELIKGLLEYLSVSADGKVGCIYPTFEEYPNRLKKERIVPFVPAGEAMHYTVEDLMQFYSVHKINTLVLINPDNPSGNYISYKECIRLIGWCKQQDMAVILDESFVDFVDIGPEEDIADVSLIRDSVLEEYHKLYIIKSISKSYGIPGARLGVLASSDEQLIRYLKKDVSIWNINSFGEFFMQIKEKYDKDYVEALGKLRECRKQLVRQLKDISFLEVYPSQANFVMCRLKGITAADLCTSLLQENIFVKDLTKKIKNGYQYIRLSIRSEEDNDRLITALRQLER